MCMLVCLNAYILSTMCMYVYTSGYYVYACVNVYICITMCMQKNEEKGISTRKR